MKSFNEYKSNLSAPSLFGNLLSYRTHAHLLHLKSKSYSEHEALGEFYKELLEQTDDLIETYQGQYGIIEIETKTISKTSSAAEFLKNAVEEIKNAREQFKKEDTHLHNIIDEIIALTYKTLYKVNNLK